MLTLDEALVLLDGDDVDEIIVQSGQAVRTLRGFTENSTPYGALSSSEIVGILQAAQLQEIVPRHDTAGEEHQRRVDGRDYRFRIARFLDLIELRISFAGVDEPATADKDLPSSSDDTVIVTAPPGSKKKRESAVDRRRARSSQRDYADPLPAPTRLPIGSEDRTEPTSKDGGASNTPTRREAAVTTGTRRGRHRTPMAPLPSLELPHDLPPDDRPALGPKTKSDLPVEGSSDGSGKSTKKLAPVEPDDNEIAPDTSPDDAPLPTPAHIAQPSATAPPVTATATQGLHDPTGFSFSEDVTAILADARRRSASDVHLISDEAPRIRIAGRLQPDGEPISAAALASAIEQVLSVPQRATLEERGYVDLGITDAAAGRLRLNICRHRGGLKVCARLVATHPLSPTDLGLPWEVEAIANHHQGLVVCSGPSGAGKTTTMAALVQLFNERQAVHIITVEDPVEIQYPPARSVISQREVGTHTLSFSAALKGALREDPDIIVIGDLRDRETVAMALSAAETGHLVIATMSTPSGAQTIGRLIDMFPPDEQNQIRATLAGALKLVVSQRLIDAVEPNQRVAAFEVITGNVPLWSLIRDQKLHQLPSLLQRGRAYGMVRLEDSLRGLMLSKTITRASALANADDPKLLGGEDNATPPSKRARGGSR